MHARLHQAGKQLYFSTVPVNVPNFISENRTTINEIVKSIQETYQIARDMQFGQAIEAGIKSYLQAEGALK